MPSGQYVDQRIVEMQIDNKKFESGAKKTISTLEKLEKALHLKSDTKALDDVERSMNKFDASGMTNGLEKVQMSFSALEVAGLRVIQNLTDAVFGFATKTVKSLTIDQVTEGWNKYEKMIESTQTIMAATADKVGPDKLWPDQQAQMDEIKKYLDTWLWFSDETSYGFTDMTDAAGKMLAANVDLARTSKMVMGVAAQGAAAGAKPAEVARIYRNLAQAMSTGSMQVRDWMSFENANVATTDFKRNILSVAAELGKFKEVVSEVQGGKSGLVGLATEFNEAGYIINATDEEIEKSFVTIENMRDSLKQDWFDTEVMEEVYARYGMFSEKLYEAVQETGLEATNLIQILDKARKQGDQFDWKKYADDAHIEADALKEIISALDEIGIKYSFSEQGFLMGQEAKTLSDAVNATKDAVSSRWMTSFEHIFGDYLQAKEFWTQVTGELFEIFAASGDLRNSILEVWNELDEFGHSGRDYLLGITYDDQGEIAFQGALWNLVDAVHSITDPISDAFNEVLFGLDEKGNLKIHDFGEALRELTKRFQEFTSELGFSTDAQNGIKTAFKGLFTVIRSGLQITAKIVQVATRIAMVFANAADGVFALGDSFNKLIHGEITFEDFATRVQEVFSNMGESIAEGLKSLLPSEEKLLSFYEKAKNKYLEVKQAFATGFTWDNIKKLLPTWDGLSSKIQKVGDYLSEKYPKITAAFQEWRKNHTIFGGILESLQGGFSKIDAFLKSINIDTGKVKEIFGEFASIIGEIFGVLFGNPEEIKQKVVKFVSSIQDGLKESFKDWTPKDYMRAIRTAGFTAILVQIGQILNGFKQMTKEFTGIPQALSGLIGNAGQLLNDYGKQFRANAYIKMAVAVGILAASLWVLSKVPEDRLTDVAVSLAMLIGVLALFAKAMNGLSLFGGKNSQLSGNKITLFNNFASILFGFAALLGTIAAVILIARKTDPSKLVGIAVGVIAVLAIMSAIAKGMSAIKFNDAGGVIGSLLAMALAIQMMIPVLVVLALMPEGRFYNAIFGTIGLFTGLGILAVAMDKFAQNGKNLMQVAGAMAIMALALDAMIPVMLICAALGGAAYGKAFVQVLGMMVLLGAMAAIMSKLKIDGKNFLLLSAGMVALALAIDLMTPAIIGITGALMAFVAAIPWQKIINDLGGFVKAFFKLGAMTVIAVGFGAALLLAGIGVALFGAGLLAASLGAAALTLVLVPLAAALPAFVNAINNIESVNLKKLGMIAGAFVAVGAAIAIVIVSLNALLKSKLGSKLATFIAGIVSKTGGMGEKISEKISQAVPKILEVLGGILILAGMYFMGIIPDLVDILVQSVITLFNSVADSVVAHRADFVDSIMRIIATFVGIAGDILGKLFSPSWLSNNLSPVATGLLHILLLLAGIRAATAALKIPTDFVTGIKNFGSLFGKGSSIADEMTTVATAAGEATTKTGGLLASLGGIATVGPIAAVALAMVGAGISVSRQEAQYTAEAFEGLGRSSDDFVTAIQRQQAELERCNADYQNLVNSGGDLTMIDEELAVRQNTLNSTYRDFANVLGISVQELQRQIDAAGGDISQIEALKQKTDELTASTSQLSAEEQARIGHQAVTNQATNDSASALTNLSASSQQFVGGLVSDFSQGKLSVDEFKASIGDLGLSLQDLGVNESLGDLGLTNWIGELSTMLQTESQAIPEGVGVGIESGSFYAEGAIDTLGSSIPQWLRDILGINSPSYVMADVATGIPEGVGQGITNGTSYASSAMQAMASMILSAASEVFNRDGGIAGGNAVIGVANGAYANLQIAYEAGVATGNAFMRGYDSATDTNSPSREMMKRGMYAIQGLINGLHQNRSDVYDEAGTIGFGIINTVQFAMAQVAMLASEQFDISPVITPVVDMTNITAATGSINGALSGAHIGLSGEITSSVSRRLDQAERVASNVEARNETINNNGDVINFNIYAAEGMDENEIADAVMVRMQSRMVRRGAAFG